MQQSQGDKLFSEMQASEYMVIFHISINLADNLDKELI